MGIVACLGLVVCAMVSPSDAALVTSGFGPGGFESTTSTSGLLYWLRADAGVAIDALGNVSSWGDQSSRQNNFTQSDSARQPLWIANGINGLPAVQFNMATPLSYTTTKKLVLSTATQPQTIVIVNTTATQTSNLSGIIGLTNASGNSDFGIRRAGDGAWQHLDKADQNDFTTANGAMYVNGAATNVAAEGSAHIMTALRGSPANLAPATGLGDYFIYSSSVTPRPWIGSIGEVVVYNRALNAVEQTVLENSLSAKYAIPLTARDHYAGDEAANGDFDRDVVGIGAEGGSQLASAGSAGFGLEAKTTLAEGTYVMAGHKTTANGRIASGMPHGVSRWDRTWHVDKTGNAEVRMAFDSANAGLAPAAPNAQVGLLYRPTSTDQFAFVQAAPTVHGTQAAFELSDSQLQDGQYTLGEITPITGGTGPGGLETTQTNSSLIYWLKADAGMTTDENGHVSAWADQTSRGNSFRQDNVNKQPSLQATGFGANSLPALRFDGDHSDPDGDGPLVRGDNADKLVLSNSTTPRTVFIVNQTLEHRGLDGIWGRQGDDFGLRRDPNSSAGWQDPGNENNFNNASSTAVPQAGRTYVNGNLGGSGAPQGSAGILTVIGNTAALQVRGKATFAMTGLGDYFHLAQAHGSRAWKGDIAEVIVYDRELNLAERSIVENALSAKYGIALSAGDHYLGDEPTKGNYDLDVFGIGCEDAANVLYNTGSAGLGIMAMLGTFDTGEWVLAGHRTPTNSLVPEADGRRWDRVWYLDATGNVDVSLTFDFSDAGLSAEGLDQPLALLYSPTNDFQFTCLTRSGIRNGDQISFLVSGSTLADGYYTLGVLPEPSTIVLLILGVVGLAVSRQRIRRK